MEKRIIFELEGTLLNIDSSVEKEYFKSILSNDDYEKFMQVKNKLIKLYEKKFINYDTNLLSKFLTNESGVTINENMIKELIEVGCLNNNILEPNSIAILEYLKSKDKSLAILTSGFRKTQIERIILSGLYDYFDDIYTGEEVIKPLPLSYKLASGSYPVEECIMIGNNLEKDVYGPSYMGMKSIYYNKDNNDNFDKKKILSINDLKELKERY